jgi:hypothetical protein
MLTSQHQHLADVDRSTRPVGSSVQIVLLAIGGAVIYGMLQDQVTARVCVEYFTIGHYDYWGLQDPTLLAFEWGVIATWWVGLFMGIPLALSARISRRRPKLSAQDLLRPALVLLASIGAVAFIAGVTGYVTARTGGVYLAEPLASLVPRTKQVAFLADLWAHIAAYGSGVLGGIVVCVWSWRKRGALLRMQANHEPGRTQVNEPARRRERILLSTLIVIGAVGLILGLLFLVAVNVLSIT